MKRYYLRENFRFLYADGQIYDENGRKVYTYYNRNMVFPRIDLLKFGVNIGHVKKEFSWFLRHYDIVYGAENMGCLDENLRFLGSEMVIDQLGWTIRGDILSMNYEVFNEDDELIAAVSQEWFRLTQRFGIEIYDEDDEELIILLILAINQYDKDKAASAAAATASCH